MLSDAVVALVLAAGRARRFGSDKRQALLPRRGPLLAATLASLRPHFADIRVVLRSEDDAVSLGVADDIGIIMVAGTEQGMGDSLACGMRVLRRESFANSVAVILGDMPWVSGDTLSRLVEQAEFETIVRPTYLGQPGHPVLFGRYFWRSLEQLTGDEGGRSVVQRHHQACIPVRVLDPGILWDVDRSADLSRNS